MPPGLKPVFAALVALTATACYWHKYDALVRTHVEVLTEYAGKIEDVLRARQTYRPEDLAEFRYPYERARDFARIVQTRFRDRPSFARFDTFLARYAELLATAERIRAEVPADDSAIAEIARRAHAVDVEGKKVLEAVMAESRKAGTEKGTVPMLSAASG